MEVNNFFSRIKKQIFRSFEKEEKIVMKELPKLKEPQTDINETKEAMIAKFNLPGMEKKDVKIKLSKDYLEIRAEKKEETTVEKKGFLKEEKSYAGYYRKIPLPAGIIGEKSKAEFKNNIQAPLSVLA